MGGPRHLDEVIRCQTASRDSRLRHSGAPFFKQAPDDLDSRHPLRIPEDKRMEFTGVLLKGVRVSGVSFHGQLIAGEQELLLCQGGSLHVVRQRLVEFDDLIDEEGAPHPCGAAIQGKIDDNNHDANDCHGKQIADKQLTLAGPMAPQVALQRGQRRPHPLEARAAGPYHGCWAGEDVAYRRAQARLGSAPNLGRRCLEEILGRIVHLPHPAQRRFRSVQG